MYINNSIAFINDMPKLHDYYLSHTANNFIKILLYYQNNKATSK